MSFTPENGLALIPARAGSKRLPGKNLRPLAGHPLLAWTIRAAQACPGLGRVHVSTDDPDYAAVARSYGADVPFLRSAAASTDEASSSAVLAEALERYGRELGFDIRWVVLLQPTSPFRTPATLARGVELFRASGGLSVAAVARQRIPRGWMLEVDAAGDVVPGSKEGPALPGHYLCGAFYACSAETLRATGGIYTPQTRALLVEDPAEALDLDTSEDWALAERLAPSFRELFFGPARI